MNVIQPMLQFHAQLKAFHWLTTSFAKHNAFGDAYEVLEDKIDTFVETYFGRFARETFVAAALGIRGDANNPMECISEFKVYLVSMNRELADAPDLLAIRDDILGEVDRLIYMLSFS